jgi:transcriptional regulator with XRE-family HTH domain
MDRNTFRRLLTQAIGPRTQKNFAELCGMTPPYLNRLLHSDSVVPTMETLTRIADHAYDGVTFAALCKACGLEPAVMERGSHFSQWHLMPEQQRADIVNQTLQALNKNWFHREGPNAMVVDSADQVTDMIADKLAQMLDTDRKTFSCEIIPDQTGQPQSAVFHDLVLYPVALTWEEPYFVCRHKFMLQVAGQTDKCIVLGLDLQEDDLKKAFVREVDPADHEADPTGVYTEIFYRNALRAYENPEETLLKSIFGRNDADVEVPTVEEGEGFYTPDLNDPAVRARVAAFFQKHKDMIPENAGTADNLYADYVDKKEQCGYCNGTFGLVAYIMRKETGFAFCFIDNPGIKQNRPLIMLSDVFFDRKNCPERQTVRNAIVPYAVELGIDRIGTVWNRYCESLPKNPEMRVPNVEQQQEAASEFAEE